MSPVRTLTLIHKELRHIVRDPQILFMVLVAPAFVLLLLAYTFAADLQIIRIGIMDGDRSAISRDYVSTLAADGEITIVGSYESYAEVDSALRRGHVNLVVVIPPGWSSDLIAGRETHIQLILDGSDYQQSLAYSRNISQRTTAFGVSLAAGMGGLPGPVDVRTRALYNGPLKWMDAMIPGLMAMAFSFPAIAAALACTRETERGSYEGLLSTPIRPIEYLLGKLLPYLTLGTAGTLLSWALACWWFRVPFRSSLGDYVALTAVFMLSLVSLSLLIGVTMASQRHAIVIVVFLFFIPSFFLSNLIQPLERGSVMERVLMVTLPATNYVDISRALFLKGASVRELQGYTMNLLRISGAAIAASLLLFRKKVA
ncbi:MAG TPA: ABC transporter permease [Chloroflexi bacterium]|jgi:ABC-2 type transport system permease protein|nr:ABC transporter permease [Chloroflexota bacterium]